MMLRDTELVQFRHTYYRLFVQFWCKEPSAGFVAALQDDIAGRIEAATAVHPLLGEGWQVIQHYLSEYGPEEVAEEFTRLFLGPFGPEVHPYESYYLTGYLFRAPLVAMRGFLTQIGLEKREQDFAEPEDVLAFELEVMRWLVSKQMIAASTEAETHWLRLQATCLKEHLLVWVPACAQDIEKARGARFYRGAAMILRGFLEVERKLFREWGMERVASLEEARRRYGGSSEWGGPMFEIAEDGSAKDAKGHKE